MLGLTARGRGPDGIVGRREVLRAGSAGLIGLALPDLLRATADLGRPAARAKSLIVFFLEGGPAHQDLWDMKPYAPENVRGEFRPIDTTVPCLQFCEHLPRTAKVAHHLALVRSVHHSVVDHNAGAYLALTGKSPSEGGRLIVSPRPDNFPPFGAVLAKLRPGGRPMPDFVHVPDWLSNNGHYLPGQDAGFLGAQFEPMVSGDPSLPGYKVPGLTLPLELDAARLGSRRELLDRLGQVMEAGWANLEGAGGALDAHYRKAYELVTSPEARRAFDLSAEPQRVRERYGLDLKNPRTKEARQFGGLPHLGQCALLARRLVEAGVRVVTLCTGRRYDQAWDTHRQHFPLLRESLLPMFDRAFSALIEDLDDRGMLESTLVVAMGEFGRTPRIGQITSSAGADANGRDHWPHCYTVLLAGGGIAGGAIHGSSDAFAAYPARDPVTPQDIAATIYAALGVDPSTILRDPRQDRPHVLSTGTPIGSLLG